MTGAEGRRRLLLVGGGGGLVGRAVLAEFGPRWQIRSLHRHPSSEEAARSVEWVRGDAGTFARWGPVLRDVDAVLNVAWYRWGSRHRFESLGSGLVHLIEAARDAGVRRFVQMSVPPAPVSLEAKLPYLVQKRQVDAVLVRSGLSYAIVRPTMLFAPGDKLLTVMLRTIYRYHRFPMFGDGEYHLSPIAVTDLAEILRTEAEGETSHVLMVGGPVRWRYRDLTDELFARLGLTPAYVRLSPQGARRLAGFLQAVGSSLLYEYEVEWLLSDLLGLPPYEGLGHPLTPLEPFLAREARRLRGEAVPGAG
jgi:uncharacterized protein YbjT (DUF2867 family)